MTEGEEGAYPSSKTGLHTHVGVCGSSLGKTRSPLVERATEMKGSELPRLWQVKAAEMLTPFAVKAAYQSCVSGTRMGDLQTDARAACCNSSL